MTRKRVTVKALFGAMLLVAVTVILSYHAILFAMPAITVVNHSDVKLTQVDIALPHSSLDFGALAPGESNTLYYFWDQSAGDYQYRFIFSSAQVIRGKCGSVTTLELHKRVTLTFTASGKIVCDER